MGIDGCRVVEEAVIGSALCQSWEYAMMLLSMLLLQMLPNRKVGP